MQHDSLSEKRLYALIGDKVCDLPPSFLERLDSILQQQRLEQALQSPTTLTLISPASREESERALHDAECQRWRRASIVCRRNLVSLSAILPAPAPAAGPLRWPVSKADGGITMRIGTNAPPPKSHPDMRHGR